MNIRNIFFVFLLFAMSCKKPSETEKQGKPLFNGQNLSGWTQMGGEADYAVEDGVIVGKTVSGTPNSFLTTNKMYDDFILELDY